MPKRLNREPRGEWKAITLSYDYIFSLSTEKCSYCLTEQQAMALVQIAEYLSWQTRWIDAAEGKNNDKLAAFAAGIQDILMSGCCDDGNEFPTRYNEDGILEIQYDPPSGDWVRAPDQGPRFNGTLFPPLVPIEGQDMKCIGAENVVNWFKQAVTETVSAMEVSGNISAIIAAIFGIIVLWIGTTVTFGLALQPLLIGLASALAFTTGSAFAAAMTEDVYERLRCNIYCHISDDGSVTEAQWQDIKAQVGEDETGIAYKFIYDNINALGPVGLTNAIRGATAESADCSDCGCSDCGCDIGTWNWLDGVEPADFERHPETCEITASANPHAGEYYIWGINTESTCCNIGIECPVSPAGGYDFIGIIACDYEGEYTWENESVGWISLPALPNGDDTAFKAITIRFHAPADHKAVFIPV